MVSWKAKRLVNLLHEDAMVNLDVLGEAIGSSRQNVSKYLSALARDGSIKYSILENADIVNARTFFIEIKTNPEEPDVVESLRNIPGIRSIDGIIGQNSLIAKFVARGTASFKGILDRIDGIVTGTRFQAYRIIECLATFKDGGKVLARPVDGRDGPPIDEVDAAILDFLQAGLDERPTYELVFDALASRFADAPSYAQVRKRVMAMRERGIIHSFTVKVSPAAISRCDFPFKFFIQILPKQLHEYTAIARGILALEDRIVEVHRTGQEYGLFAACRAASIVQYKEFLEGLYATGKIQDTVSTLVIDEKLPATFVPFNPAGDF